MKLDFGKKVHVGNFVFFKYNKSLSGKDARMLRSLDGCPASVKESLSRGKLPYIKVMTVSMSWSVEFVYGTSMYNALDAVKVVFDDEKVYQLSGVEAKNVEAIFVAMFADTTTVGDYDYQVSKQKLLSEYLERASAHLNAADDIGKTDEMLKKESDDAVNEVIKREETKDIIMKVSDKLSKED